MGCAKLTYIRWAKADYFVIVQHKFCALYVCRYFRVYPYLCRAVRNFVTDHCQTQGQALPAKEYYVSFTDVSRRLKYDCFCFFQE